MRVAIGTEEWTPAGIGMFTYCQSALNAARAAGVDAFLFPIPAGKFGTRFGGLLLPWLRQTFLTCPIDADVIHYTNTDTRRGVDVVTIHDLYGLHDTRFVGGRVRRATIRGSVRRVRSVIVSNDAVKRELAAWLPKALPKIRVVPIPHQAVDTQRLEPVFDGLWIGRHASNKRLMDYVRLAQHLPHYRFAVRWTYLTGQTARDAELEQAISQTPNLTQLPVLSDDELNRLYRQSRVMVSTSTMEGWHRPITEGYLRGAHVVLPRVEPYLSIFPADVPHWYTRDADGRALEAAFLEAVSDSRPVRPSPDFVASMSFATVGQKLRAVYEEAARR